MVSAESATTRFDVRRNAIRLQLKNPLVLEGPIQGGTVENFEVSLGLTPPRGRLRLRYHTGAELRALQLRSQEGLLAKFSEHEILGELHSRLALATSPLLFVLLGAPLAMIFRSGNRIFAFLLAFVFGLFVYYPSLLIAETLAEQEVMHPVVAAWSGNALMGLLGLGFLFFVVRR